MFNGRQQESPKDIIQGGFWGEIDIAEFVEARGIPLQIPQKLIVTALIYAMQSLDLDLQEVEQQHIANGILTAADISPAKYGEQNSQRMLYKKAVFARAKNELLPEFATLSARELHEKREIIREQKQLEAEVVHAIRLLKGKKRGSVYFL